MLSRQKALELLLKYSKGEIWVKHCFAVAEAAVKVGDILAKKLSVDISFLWSAALLHDIGRCMTHDPLLHGVEGYKLLLMLGYEKEAYICASHILYGLNATEAMQLGLPNRDFIPRSIEEKLVPLVDYLIEYDQPTTLENRFLSLRKRNSGNTFFLERLDRAYEKAQKFKQQIEDVTGESVEKIVASS